MGAKQEASARRPPRRSRGHQRELYVIERQNKSVTILRTERECASGRVKYDGRVYRMHPASDLQGFIAGLKAMDAEIYYDGEMPPLEPLPFITGWKPLRRYRRSTGIGAGA